jgi:four helix bundle protein
VRGGGGIKRGQLPATSFRLPASGFRFPASGFLLPASGFRFGLPAEHPDCSASFQSKELAHAGLSEATNVAEGSPTCDQCVRTSCVLAGAEGWALRDQILKAVISIPSNIAEGAGRGSDPDFARFLWYSMGSCHEFESDLILGGDVKLIPTDVLTHLGNEVSEVRQVLTRLIQTVEGC